MIIEDKDDEMWQNRIPPYPYEEDRRIKKMMKPDHANDKALYIDGSEATFIPNEVVYKAIKKLVGCKISDIMVANVVAYTEIKKGEPTHMVRASIRSKQIEVEFKGCFIHKKMKLKPCKDTVKTTPVTEGMLFTSEPKQQVIEDPTAEFREVPEIKEIINISNQEIERIIAKCKESIECDMNGTSSETISYTEVDSVIFNNLTKK